MPNWVKHVCFGFVLLLLLARWRQVAEFISGIGSSLTEVCRNSSSSPHDSFMSLLVLGILAVTITALWAIWCRSKSEKKP
jgi:RsiW-degrading membrane proteinase PrsW (M82 family)